MLIMGLDKPPLYQFNSNISLPTTFPPVELGSLKWQGNTIQSFYGGYFNNTFTFLNMFSFPTYPFQWGQHIGIFNLPFIEGVFSSVTFNSQNNFNTIMYEGFFDVSAGIFKGYLRQNIFNPDLNNLLISEVKGKMISSTGEWKGIRRTLFINNDGQSNEVNNFEEAFGTSQYNIFLLFYRDLTYNSIDFIMGTSLNGIEYPIFSVDIGRNRLFIGVGAPVQRPTLPLSILTPTFINPSNIDNLLSGIDPTTGEFENYTNGYGIILRDAGGASYPAGTRWRLKVVDGVITLEQLP
jgi:hypothetical protein